ncbi:hypothetical protein, partial [Veillonella sp. 3960]
MKTYRCISCNKSIVADFNGKLQKGMMKKSEKYLCPTCFKSRNLINMEIEDLEYEELLALYKKKKWVSPEDFTVTHRVHRVAPGRANNVYIELDEKRQLVNIPLLDTGFFSDTITDYLVPFDNIVDFAIIDNGNQTGVGSSLVGAAVGGLLFGEAGGIIGAMLPSRTDNRKCEMLQIKLVLNSIGASQRYINFIGEHSGVPPQSRSSYEYKNIYKALEECVSLLTIIMKRNAEKINNT